MKNYRILVVEDSRTQAEELRALLEPEGAQVEIAWSAEAALARLQSENAPVPDLVLSDVVMPGLSGYELTQRLKAHKAFKQIPVVLLTSLSDPLDIVRGLECGADNYVTKPFDPEYLVARLRNVLAQKSLRRGQRASLGVNVHFLGKTFTITSDREQILDLFLSSVEDVVRTNQALQESQQELAEAQRQLEVYARQMTERAFASDERMRAVVSSSPEAIIAYDVDGRVTLWNPAAERIFGFRADEIIGKANPVVPEDKRDEFNGALEMARAGRPSRHETQRTTKDGARLDVVVSVAALRNARGQPEGAVAIVEDITEQKRTAEALSQSQAQLVQAQKMEAVGRLAGGIAHDFNNLLTVIRSYSEMLQEDLTERNSERHHYASEIVAAADRASALTRQLLTFSRKQVVQPRLINVDEVVHGAEQMLRRLIAVNIALRVQLGTQGLLVRMDAGQLEQVLMNLVINASDAMHGGGQLDVLTRTVEVAPNAADDAGELSRGTYVVLSVTDTGYGMDQATIDRIFEPFFTTKAAASGTGLGLSIAYGIVKEQGGNITVQSEPGRGTTFEVYFRAEPEAEELVQEAPTEVPTGDEVVLIVDDDDAVRAAVRVALERFGYTVLDAQNGGQALRVCEMLGSPPDLLLTDLMMPEVTGRELIEELERNGRVPRVLMMSGYTDDEVLRRGLADSRYAFLQKPFTREALARKVREVLDSTTTGEWPIRR